MVGNERAEDSGDKPGSILMEAAWPKIIIFFIKPSDFNLGGIPLCACVRLRVCGEGDI